MTEETTRKELLIEYHLWEAVNWRAAIKRAATSSAAASMTALCDKVSEKEPLSPSEVEILASAAVQAGLLERHEGQVQLTELGDMNDKHRKEAQ